MTDVDALVALLPVASGRSFVREQRMLGARLLGPEPSPAAPGVASGSTGESAPARVVLGGFTLAPELAASLSALKWPDAPVARLRDALVLTPAPQPGDAIAQALQRLGARVTAWSDTSLGQALDIAHRAFLAPRGHRRDRSLAGGRLYGPGAPGSC